jgi:hypothetical protein
MTRLRLNANTESSETPVKKTLVKAGFDDLHPELVALEGWDELLEMETKTIDALSKFEQDLVEYIWDVEDCHSLIKKNTGPQQHFLNFATKTLINKRQKAYLPWHHSSPDESDLLATKFEKARKAAKVSTLQSHSRIWNV